MTNKELIQAIEMNESGIPWKYVANHFRITELELRKQRKLYYESNKTEDTHLCRATETSG